MYRWSVSYNIGGSGKNAVCIEHHNHVTGESGKVAVCINLHEVIT